MKMKLLVISDIHGSEYYANKIDEIIEKEKPDKLILLGDLYYHGPRNSLPDKYNPMKVAEILNLHADIILAIKGNCDAEVDEKISNFEMVSEYVLEWENKKIFLSHGHKYNLDNWPNVDFDIMLYGHFHMGFIHEESGKCFASPGSISMPKNQTQNSYLILEQGSIMLKDVDGNVIEEHRV